MSSTNLSMAENALQARLRDKLNLENVRLWKEPFYMDTTKTVVDSEIIALARRYATELKLNESEAIDCLFSLQRNALDRLTERDHFKNTGLSTLRMKFSGFSTKNTKEGSVERIQINLSQASGKDLKARVAEMSSMDESKLKLICQGRVVREDVALEQQNVKNSSLIMVLCVAGNGGSALQTEEDQFRQLEETREAADYLAGQEQSDNMYSLQIADQHGKPINLPAAEKKAIAIALALHEKGRAAIKAQAFSRALVFLLEADSVYSQCHSGILDMVDNYGLLNLDIAWCYLQLQSISELPSVEIRLMNCEKALHRSYGESLERVVALKGSTGWEAALFVRLDLLQGIAAYHLGHLEKSKFFITKVDNAIGRLRVSDAELADLINMGYTEEESRLALRATYGSLEGAVNFIIQKREEQKEVRKQEKEQKRNRKLQRRLGVTEAGDPVSVSLFENMREMGYNPVLANAALKRANNDINSALQLVQDNIFISSVIAGLNNDSSLSETRAQSNSVQGTSGISEASSIPSLPGISPSVEFSINASYDVDNIPDEEASLEERERSQKAYENLSKDMGSESDYIDLTLSAETEYLEQYKSLLQI